MIMATLDSFARAAFHGGLRLLSKAPACGPFQPPKGTFSAREEIEKGRLRGDILACGQGVASLETGSVTYKAGMRQHDQQWWPIVRCETENAKLCGSTRQWRNDADRFCIEGAYYQHKLANHRDGIRATLFPGSPLRIEGACTSIVSVWNHGQMYYHWMLDGLTRLIHLSAFPGECQIIIPESPLTVVRESLELLGLSHRVITTAGPSVSPERFFFAGPLAMTGCWNPIGYDWIREQFSPYFEQAASGKRYFLTRRTGTRVPPFVARLEATFEVHGFECIDCGELSLKEQICLLSSASAIAGLHGGALTNLLWARPGTPIMEIFMPDWLNGCYELIAHHLKLDYQHTILEPNSAADLTPVEVWCETLPAASHPQMGLL